MQQTKYSNNVWIGNIPTNWGIKRFKHCINLYTGNSISDNQKDEFEDSNNANPYISSKDINRVFSRINYENGMYVKKNDYGFKIAHKEDSLLCIEGGSAGKKKAFLERDVAFVNKLCCLHSKCFVSKKFLYYFISSPSFEEEFAYNISGLIGGVSVSKLKEFKICFPELQRQKIIVEFLDKKCGEIDGLISDIEKEIEILNQYKKSIITESVTRGLNNNAEIQNSRIYYMAPYNKNWTLSKIGYICKKLNRSFNEEDKPLICSNKGTVSIRPEEMRGKMVSEDNAMQGIHKGDIAIHGMDTWHGAIALSNLNGKITRVVHVCNTTQNPGFVVYYLQHLAYSGVYKLISNGVRGNTSDFRSWDKVSDIYIAFPSFDEQKAIVEYLDNRILGIRKTIEERNKQIETLEKYKKSIIYEYVTGKKEVK